MLTLASSHSGIFPYFFFRYTKFTSIYEVNKTSDIQNRNTWHTPFLPIFEHRSGSLQTFHGKSRSLLGITIHLLTPHLFSSSNNFSMLIF